jgi:hypothetical protein
MNPSAINLLTNSNIFIDIMSILPYSLITYLPHEGNEVGKMKRTTSVYDNDKVKVILSVSRHHRDKFQIIAKMYGVNMNFLFSLVCDELFYEPLAPKLPQRLENTHSRVSQFFIRHSWKK